MGKLATQIEIQAPPEKVREVFLNFSKLPEYTQGFIKSIEPLDTSKSAIEVGDKLKVIVGTESPMTFYPRVLENSPQAFVWRGSLPSVLEYLGVGDHSFRFEPSTTTAGGTTLVHGENFTGICALMMMMPGSGAFGSKTKPGFEGFNRDLKRKVETGQ